MMDQHTHKTPALGLGFRYSPYGPAYNPGAEYWARVGREMAGRVAGAIPEAVWIVSILDGKGTRLSFPGTSTDENILFSADDENQAALDLFDRLGLRIWLQVEPGEAGVPTLFDLVLERYGHHPCVVGLGVDVEWHHSHTEPEGEPVGDIEAAEWLVCARKHNPSYRLFLKHWECDKLPLTLRDGFYFIDDSQMFTSLDQMVAEFAAWGRHFHPSPVGFQVGYPADQAWWGEFKDPATTIAARILDAVPNCAGIYWVDFTVLNVFPPKH